MPGRATGRPNFSPLSGRRAEAGARFAMSPSGVRSPLLAASAAPRSAGTLASTACRSTTWSPSTMPSRNPPSASNPTIFMGRSSLVMDCSAPDKAPLAAHGNCVHKSRTAVGGCVQGMVQRGPSRSVRITRDPERTRGAILAAATQEFTANGLTGARVDAIAQARARQQAHDLSLFRRQGRALSGGAGGDLRVDPRRRAGPAPDRPRSGRRHARAGAVHLALFPRPPGIPEPARHREPAQGRAI